MMLAVTWWPSWLLPGLCGWAQGQLMTVSWKDTEDRRDGPAPHPTSPVLERRLGLSSSLS